MTEAIKEIERRLTEGGFLYEKIENNEKLYPISLEGLLCLCSNLTMENNDISIQVIQEVIDENFSWEDGEKQTKTKLCNDFNITKITVPPLPSKIEGEDESKLGNKKEAYYKKVAEYIIPKIYEKIDSEKKLNFIIWSSDEHRSIVAECDGNYYFLDSCGCHFQRFPDKFNDKYRDNDKYKIGKNIFYINSQVQADDVNCSSYCFEFMEQLINVYKAKENTEEFNKYLKEYFNEDGHEYCVEYKTRIHGLLPPELLQYFQSFSFLKDIEQKFLSTIETNIEELKNKIKKIEDRQEELRNRELDIRKEIEKDEEHSDAKYGFLVKERNKIQQEKLINIIIITF